MKMKYLEKNYICVCVYIIHIHICIICLMYNMREKVDF